MPNTAQRPQRYSRMIEELRIVNETGCGQLLQIITKHTDLDRATDLILADVLTDISYGLIRHADSRVRYALNAISNLYCRRAAGQHVMDEEWDAARQGIQELVTALSAPDQDNLSLHVAEAGYAATNPHDDLAPVKVIAAAIGANEAVGEIPHEAMISWITATITQHTKRATVTT